MKANNINSCKELSTKILINKKVSEHTIHLLFFIFSINTKTESLHDGSNEFVWSDESLFACDHVLESYLAFIDFVFTSKSNE